MACRLIEGDRHDSMMSSQIGVGLLLCFCHGGELILAMAWREMLCDM
jgi:hypothetical protein